jgi:hypothetical protein
MLETQKEHSFSILCLITKLQQQKQLQSMQVSLLCTYTAEVTKNSVEGHQHALVSGDKLPVYGIDQLRQWPVCANYVWTGYKVSEQPIPVPFMPNLEQQNSI